MHLLAIVKTVSLEMGGIALMLMSVVLGIITARNLKSASTKLALLNVTVLRSVFSFLICR